jgi:phosphate starvation-inducible protein PhoH and related proteins
MATPSPVEPAREFDLAPADNARLANLCGPLDENLRLIEDRMSVSVKRRGANFRVVGARAHAAEDVIRDLFEATRHEDVSLERVHLALRDSRDMPGALPRQDDDALARDEPADSGSVRVARGTIRARGRNQKDYLQNIRVRDLTFGIGPAGTGKTYLAVASAVEALQADKIRRIVLTRPAVEAGERLGFLPGDLTQKVDPYLRPIYDALYEMLGFDRVARYIERNVIEVAPLAFMRGRSLNDSYIILDEAQNTTPEQMKMFLTRIGFGSRAVVTGDVTQTDLPAGKMSGLKHVINILRHTEGVAFTFFEAADVVRHPLVQRIVQAYEAHAPTDRT